jgi:hypothetical protein
VPGGTVTKATADPFSHVSNTAYKVHLTEAEGTHVCVIGDASFNMLAVKAARRCGRHDFGEHNHSDQLRHRGFRAHRS